MYSGLESSLVPSTTAALQSFCDAVVAAEVALGAAQEAWDAGCPQACDSPPTTRRVRFCAYNFQALQPAPSPNYRTGCINPGATASVVECAVQRFTAVCDSSRRLREVATRDGTLEVLVAALQAVEPRQPGPVALLHSELAGEASAHSGRGLEPQRPFAVLLGRYMCAALRFRLRRALIGPVCHNVRTDPASDVKSAWAEADLAALCHHALRALVDHNDVFEAVLAGDSDSAYLAHLASKDNDTILQVWFAVEAATFLHSLMRVESLRLALQRERFWDMVPALEAHTLDLDEYTALGHVEALRARLESQAPAVALLRKCLLQAMKPRKMLVNLVGFPRVVEFVGPV